MPLTAYARQRVLFLILCIVWGTTWIAIKVGITAVPPALFSGSRWVVAGLVLVGVLVARGEGLTVPARVLGRVTLVALLMVSLTQVIQLYGMRHITSGLAAVIVSALMPIGLLGFSVMLGHERFSLRQAGATALGVAGILVLFGPSALSGDLDLRELLGALAVVVATLCYAAGTVLARPLMRTMAPLQLAAVTNLVGGVALLLPALLFEPGAGAALTGHWGWAAWSAWLYLLLAGSLLASVIYLMLVHAWGASRTGTYAFVSPVVAVAIGSGLFDERLQISDVAGMAIMLSAAALVLRRPVGGRSAAIAAISADRRTACETSPPWVPPPPGSIR